MSDQNDWEFSPETIIKYITHPELGLPLLAEGEILKFKVKGPENFNKAPPILDKYIVYKDVPILVRGKYISQESITKIRLRYPQEKWVLSTSYTIPVIKEITSHIVLPSTAHDLIMLYKHTCIVNSLTIANPPKEAAFWLSLFCYYDEYFCACYDKYMKNPDVGVVIIEDLKTYAETKFDGVPKKEITPHDIRATCHLILITMNKTFAPNIMDRDKQLTTYLKNRKSTVYASMGVPIRELLYIDIFFTTLSDTFRVLPKLRKMLFLFMYTTRTSPEFSTVCVLLIHSSMTTIRAMIDFIYVDKKTLAHNEPKILEEINHFLTVIKNKKNQDGALWPYHRILYSDDGDLNAANFPNLAIAAILYHKKYGEPSFQFMVTPSFPTIPGLKDKAIELHTRPIYTIGKKVEYSLSVIEGAKILGLDIKKLEGTKGFQEKINAEESKRDEFKKVFEKFLKEKGY